MTDDQTPVVTTISRRWPLVSGAVAVVLAGGLAVLLAIRGNVPFEADAEWMEEILEHRNPAWEVPALLMNFLGGGWFAFVLPAAVIVVLCLRKRYWSGLFLGIASVASALLVQLLKGIVGRPRPEEMLVTADFGSFPSGHSANAATLAVCLGIIVWRAWVWAAGAVYVVLMMLSRTYLGAHWISDTVGGLLVGTAVALIVWAPLARKVRGETRR